MKKIRRLIKAILSLIKNPWLLNNVIADDALWTKYLIKKHNIHSSLPVLDFNQITQNQPETVESLAFLDGSSLPTDITLLKSLSKRFKNCKYFEIGTWRGESVVNVAEHAEECYTLNISKDEMLAQGFSKSYIEQHDFFSKEKDNIKHLKGNSLTFDFEGLNKKFDLIFIDGNHHYEHIKNDTEKVFKHLIHNESIIVWHDYAYNPEKLRPETLAAILDGTPQEFKQNLYQVSNTLCAIFIRGDFTTSEFKTPITPNKRFKIKIETKNL